MELRPFTAEINLDRTVHTMKISFILKKNSQWILQIGTIWWSSEDLFLVLVALSDFLLQKNSITKSKKMQLELSKSSKYFMHPKGSNP